MANRRYEFSFNLFDQAQFAAVDYLEKIGWVLRQGIAKVLSDEFELVSVCWQTLDPMRNKAPATRRERRRGSA